MTKINKENKNNINNQNQLNKLNLPEEIGGRGGLEPTRYGVETPEWEKNGRVSDF